VNWTEPLFSFEKAWGIPFFSKSFSKVHTESFKNMYVFIHNLGILRKISYKTYSLFISTWPSWSIRIQTC